MVHGREDQVIPLANAYRLLELVPRAELHAFSRLVPDSLTAA